MLNLPYIIIQLLNPFAPCVYGETTWMKAQMLLFGTILAPGKRTVTAALCVMGLKDETKVAQYHPVLNRAIWEPLDLAQVRLGLLTRTFYASDAPLVFGIDETIERRWGEKIAARGIYRDPVRSSKSHFVEASGLRWQVEVTHEEARRHLGVEIQRQWSNKAIARTTPILLGLFSWITLVAHVFHLSRQPVIVRQSAWYPKSLPTFSDALALVRYQLWFALPTFQTSGLPPDRIKVSQPFFVSLVKTLCYAA